MAAPPTDAKPAEQIKGVPDASRSHGRGGAGNINARKGPAEEADLSTPTIKSDLYTTGRGGQGNMATNLKSHPEFARAAQDVDAPAAHQKEQRGTYHWGRGGEGNVMTVGGSDKKEKERNSSKGPERRGSFQGAIEKGKEMLGLGKKNGKSEKEKGKEKETVSEDNAIAD